MKKLSLLLSISLIFSILTFSQGNNSELKLRSGDISHQLMDQDSKLNDLIGQMPSAGNYFLIQFSSTPDAASQSELNSKGIELLEYIPEYAFLANLSNYQGNEKLADLNIDQIIAWEGKYKFPNYFDLNAAPDYIIEADDNFRLMVDRQLDVEGSAFASFLEQNGIEIEAVGIVNENFKIKIESSKVAWLADQGMVKFIDYAPAPPEPEDREARSLHRVNMLDSPDPLGRKLNGDSVSMAIADNGVGPHIDRQGRITMHTTTNNGTHGDMTTGIAVGAGNLDPRNAGMATHTYLHYYNISGYPHINQAVNNLNLNGVVITSTSFSQGCNAGYTSDTRGVDLQVNANQALLHVFSAGNSAGSSCGTNAYGAGTPWGTITGGIKQAKSTIATGNLNYLDGLVSSSSRGPAADGRIKPDICSNGGSQTSTTPNNGYGPGGGTSAAAPGIAGSAALLYQGYRNLNNQSNPPSGLIKAAMLNTARDLGNRGPDFYYGWGRINAHRAMLLLEDNRYLNGSISQNNTNTHTISVTNSLEELRVMVYWTDAAGSTVASKALVNDINIKVVTPNNDTLLPWILDPTPNAFNLSQPATRGIDDLNNMEQVMIDTAGTGSYTVIVEGASIPSGPQSYHLVWETVSNSIEVTYPAGGEAFNPNETETIRWDANGNTGSFTVEYSTDNGSNWSTISSNVPGARRYYNWNVPSAISGDVLVRVSRSGNVTGVSANTFSIMPIPTGINVNYTCPDSVEISWQGVPQATAYDVYLLGNTHMDSVATSTTNSVVLYNLNLSNDNWFALKARGNGISSRRSTARLLQKNTVNCPIGYDFAITQINSPADDYIPTCGAGKQAVRVTIHNAGDSILSNIPVRLRAGSTVYYDTIVGPINPSAYQFFTFRDSLALNTTGSVTISAINGLLSDQNDINDSISRTIEVIPSTTFNVPYSNDFENFTLCATTNNCGGTNCNLNGGWTNISNNIDAFDMRVNSGSTPSTGTGPASDANPGTASGKYIYSEASNNCYALESVVITPCFDLTNTISPEFSFYYHMQGTAMGIIRVDVYANGSWNNNVMAPLFGNLGNTWLREDIDLTPYNGQVVTLRFRFRTGSSWSSDMAIDDVTLIDKGVGIAEVNNNEYKLFPNPSDGQFRIQLKKDQIGEVRVFDLQGRNVYTNAIRSAYGEIDLSGLDKGVYIIEFKDGTVREKIMIN